MRVVQLILENLQKKNVSTEKEMETSRQIFLYCGILKKQWMAAIQTIIFERKTQRKNFQISKKQVKNLMREVGNVHNGTSLLLLRFSIL